LKPLRAIIESELTELETKSAEYRARTDQNLAEITDKLNGLIGYVEGNGSSKQ